MEDSCAGWGCVQPGDGSKAGLVLSKLRRTGEVLRVADVLHPVDDLAVERFLDGDVGHRRGRRGAMPVAVARRAEDHVAGADLLDRAVLALRPAAAGRDDEYLAQRMRVPGRARARLEGDARAGGTCGRGSGEQRVDADRAGEPLGRPLHRRPGTIALDLHGWTAPGNGPPASVGTLAAGD